MRLNVTRRCDALIHMFAPRSSNSLRVIKTTKQTSAEAITYPQVSDAWLQGASRRPYTASEVAACARGRRGCTYDSSLPSYLPQIPSNPHSRAQVVRSIIAKDGLVNGLLIRGLGTKILANGLQGMMFTVLWRLGQDWWATKEAAA